MTTRCGSTGSTASRAGAGGAESRSAPRAAPQALPRTPPAAAFAALLATALAGALLLGCSTATSGSEKDGEGNPDSRSGGTGAIAEASALFIASAADPSLIAFSTNDSAYTSDKGYTLWALKAASQSPFVSRKVVLTKTSGSAEAGYGIVFCHHGADERMLVVMIDAQGEYIVGEALGSDFTEIVPWTSSAFLKRGYSQDNTIELSLDEGTKVFSLSINGEAVKTFTAIESAYDLSGGNGYLVVVSPWDSFPATPVSVAFKEL